MTIITTLPALMRDMTNKTARAVRRDNNVPAVIYGDKQTPVTIALEGKLLAKQLEKPGFLTQLFDLDLDGKKHRVLPRDVQYDPVSDRPIHVDFLRVSANTKVRVNVPFLFLNADKAPGIKRGGTLNVVHHAIEVVCAPDKIPAKFEISLEGLQINDAVHLGAVVFPEGVKPTTLEKDFTIATIAVPSAIRSEAEDAAAATATAAAATPAAGDAAAAPADAAKAGAAKPGDAKAAPADAAKKPEKK